MNPGSDEALDAGCTCPVLDNDHGRGYYGLANVFVYDLLCPLHGIDKMRHALSEMAAEAQKEGDYFG